MSALWVLCCPCLMTSAHWPSTPKKPASLCSMTRHDSTFGPTRWVPCLCRPARTAGWWMWARVLRLRSASATLLWDAKAPGTMRGWATTPSPGCCLATMGTIPSSTQGRRCHCRWWGRPRGSASCWTGPVRRCCFTSRTLVLCCTSSLNNSLRRCCPPVLWPTAASQFCTDRQSKWMTTKMWRNARESFPLMQMSSAALSNKQNLQIQHRFLFILFTVAADSFLLYLMI